MDSVKIQVCFCGAALATKIILEQLFGFFE